MSLFRTLEIGVTGLNAQSSKLSVISNNIANVNTVGYKQSVASFSDLITDSSPVLYSAHGVSVTPLQRVTQQGLLQHTSSPTDLAISGGGLFVVNTASDSTGQTEYTRAGSFSPDASGNYRNSAGYYLQAWLLGPTNNILTPGTLQTVNLQNISSAPAATTTVSIAANLNATQSALASPTINAALDPLDTTNTGINSTKIIAPDAIDHMQRGDQFTITDTPPSPATANIYTYTYGGYTMGRDVTSAAASGNGDNGYTPLVSPVALTNPFQTAGSGSGDVVVTVPSTAGMNTGDVVTISGATAVGGITAGQLNGSFIITVLSPTTYRITTAGSDPAVGGTAGGGAGVSEAVRPYAGAIFDAIAPDQKFFGITGTSNIDPAALKFSITTAASGTVQFTYTAGTPVALAHTFNTMESLSDAINSVSGLTSRVVNGRLYVGASDANASVTFTNGQSVGTPGTPVKAGVNWVGELGLSNIAAGSNRFSTLGNLASLINASAGLSASVSNPLGNSTMQIHATSPLDSIDMADRSVAAPIALAANAYTTSLGSNLVTVTATIPAPGVQPGDTVTLSGLAAGTYNGIPNTALNGSFIVQSVGAGTFTIAAKVASNAVTAGTFGAGGEVLNAGTNGGSILGELGVLVPSTPVVLAANGYTTTAGSATVTITATVVPALQPGDSVTLSGLAAGTYNGIPDTALNRTFIVSSVGVGNFTVTAPVSPTLVTAGSFGAGGELLAPPKVSASLNSAALTNPVPDTGVITAAYSPTSTTANMASGAVSPQFSRAITVYDSAGTAHNLTMGFLKTGINTWAAEIYVPAADLTASADGQLAYGTVVFNGDGTLQSVSPALTGPVTANWSTTGALPGSITFALGTAGLSPLGKSDGLSQFDSGYNVGFTSQDGFPAGQLVGISVDEQGNIAGTFNTGQNKNLFRIPLAQFVSPDNLEAVNGNAYIASTTSGAATIGQAGANGLGFIGQAELEVSTTDLAGQLTEMIIAQRAYQSNSKLISTSDDMLQTIAKL